MKYEDFKEERERKPDATASQCYFAVKSQQTTRDMLIEFDDGKDYPLVSVCEFEVPPYSVKVEVSHDDSPDLSWLGEFKWSKDYSYKDEVIYFDEDYLLPKLKDMVGPNVASSWWNSWPKYFVWGQRMSAEDAKTNIEYWVRHGMTRHEAQMKQRKLIWDDMQMLLDIYDDEYSMVGIVVTVKVEGEELGQSSCWGYQVENGKYLEEQDWFMDEVHDHIRVAVAEAKDNLPQAVADAEQRLGRLRLFLFADETNATLG